MPSCVQSELGHNSKQALMPNPLDGEKQNIHTFESKQDSKIMYISRSQPTNIVKKHKPSHRYTHEEGPSCTKTTCMKAQPFIRKAHFKILEHSQLRLKPLNIPLGFTKWGLQNLVFP